MNKKVFKIELDGNIVGTKPLIETDNLIAIRKAIKGKVDIDYIFLDQEGNTIDTSDENDYKLEDILNGKIIKIKSTGEDKEESTIKVYMNDKQFCSINCTKENNLEKVRKLLNNRITEDFIFLDTEENKVDKNDEKDYHIEDILINEVIKLKSDSSNDTDNPPATPVNNSDQKKSTKKEIFKREKKKINLSNYCKIEEYEDLSIYKYSNVEKQKIHDYVYKYNYDNFESNDYDNAYVILFCGKTGDGKTTAINAFFNIIKGIKLGDNYRFNLITEENTPKGQAESQTNGVHLYYVKDYNNNPVIIIDSQGYGDTRGKEYDDLVNEAFEYVFSQVIEHINIACFIVKSDTNRLDLLTKYIFSSVTSLFSEDISENFIILSTFCNKTTLKQGPAFIKSIKTDADFLNLEKKMDTNWWYAIDSVSILSNDNDDITKYSFSKANELYEEKVKKIRPKPIKKCSEVLKTRTDLKNQVNFLNETFRQLIEEQGNLHKKEEDINKVSLDISNMELDIANLEKDMNKYSEKELEQKMRSLNDNLNSKMNDLSSQTESKEIKKLKYCESSKATHCDICEDNCHTTCDCNFSSLGRCTVFTWWTQECEKCHHPKSKHKNDYYYYIKETIKINKNTDKEKEEERKKAEEEKKKILDEMNKKNHAKSDIQKQKNELYYNKNKLIDKKNIILNEKNNIQNKIKDINNKILFIIIKLQRISEKINDIAMNNNHIKTENDYIDDLISKMDKMDLKEKEKLEKIEKIKQNNKVFQQTVKLNREQLLKLSDSDLAEKLKIIFK